MAEVVVVERIEDLSPWEEAWGRLLAESPGGSFFHSLPWLRCYWRHFGNDQQLRVQIVLSRGRVVGILPLTIRVESTGVGAIRVLTYPLADWGSYFGPVGPNPTATLTAAARAIAASERDWDLCDLRWIRGDLDRGRSRAALDAAGLDCRPALWKQLALLEIDGRWEDYLASRDAKFRQNIRRCRRVAERAGVLRFERWRPPASELSGSDASAEAMRYFEICCEISRRSWQGGATDGTTLCHAHVEPFFRACHVAATRLGMIDVTLLHLDEQPVAFTYNYHHAGQVTGLRAGFDALYRSAQVGTVLYAESFADSFARGDKVIDLGPGSLEAKRHWQTRRDVSRRCTHYSWSAPRVQLLRLKHWWDGQIAAQT